jgi:hypothetical protein
MPFAQPRVESGEDNDVDVPSDDLAMDVIDRRRTETDRMRLRRLSASG